MARILVVERDSAQWLRIGAGLRSNGFQVERFERSSSAVERHRVAPGDLLLLGQDASGDDGCALLGVIRERGVRVPIVMLVDSLEEPDRLRGLALGAEDCLFRSCPVPELLASIRMLLKTTRLDSDSAILVSGPFMVDQVRFRAFLAGQELRLTSREFLLLLEFMRHPGVVLDRETLVSRVWERDAHPNLRAVDVHITRLRKKLGDAGRTAITTLGGKGYRWSQGVTYSAGSLPAEPGYEHVSPSRDTVWPVFERDRRPARHHQIQRRTIKHGLPGAGAGTRANVPTVHQGSSTGEDAAGRQGARPPQRVSGGSKRPGMGVPGRFKHTHDGHPSLEWLEQNYRTDPVRSARIIRELLPLTERAGKELDSAWFRFYSGWLAIDADNFNQALELLESPLRVFSMLDNSAGQIRALNAIGAAHVYMGHYAQAMDCYQRSFQLAEQTDHMDLGGGALLNIANLLHELDQDPEALDAVEAFGTEQSHRPFNVPIYHHVRGLIFRGLGQVQEAERDFAKAIELGEGRPHDFLDSRRAMATMLLDRGRLSEAEAMIQAGIRDAERYLERVLSVRFLILQARVDLARGERRHVLSILDHAVGMARRLGTPRVEAEAEQARFTVWREIGDSGQALEAHLRYCELKDACRRGVKQRDRLRTWVETSRKGVSVSGAAGLM